MIALDDVMQARRHGYDRFRVDEGLVQLHPLVARKSGVGLDPRPE
jgi:hypothetical protein